MTVGSVNHKVVVLRTMRNWTQTDLAEHSGVKPEVISRLERGQTRFQQLTVETALALSAALGLTIEGLLAWEIPAFPGSQDGAR